MDNEHAVDFVGAFKDAVDARVAVRAANGIIFVESVAAEDLHRFVHDKIQHLAAVDLGDGALDGIFLQNFHGVLNLISRARSRRHGRLDVSCRAVYHRFHRENLYGHLRQFFFHQAEIADLFSKRFALLRIF